MRWLLARLRRLAMDVSTSDYLHPTRTSLNALGMYSNAKAVG